MDQEYYIKKWLNGTLTAEEKAIFEQSEDFRELNKIDQALADFKAPDLDHHTVYENIRGTRPQSKQVSFPIKKILLRVAAVLIPLLTIVYLWTQNSGSTQTISATQQNVEHFLPDESEVTLNVQSNIRYLAKQWPQKRSLQLEGEAYFKVSKGASFTVNTDYGVVTVLGTEFNVKNRPDYFEVICYEGRVQVQTSNQDRILEPGQMFRFINGTVVFDESINAAEPSWLKQVSSFTSIPYQQVIEELERQYSIRINSEAIDLDQLFTGSFPHGDLEVALRSVTQPLNISYSTSGKTVTLHIESN